MPDILLPFEILDHIFSFLRTDTKSLKACADVNPCFFDIVEKHLYNHITVHNQQGSERGRLTPAQLSKLLHDSPHIAAYVQSLRIVITSPGILRWFMTRSLNDEEIAPIIPLLPQLRKIAVTTRRGARIAWPRLHSTFHSAVIQSLHLPSMVELTLHGIDCFPLSALNDCVSLRRISFAEIFEVDSTQIQISSTGTRPRLESLAIHRCSPPLPDILSWITSEQSPDISGLRSIDFQTLRSEDLNRLAVLLQACSNSLIELELDPGKEFHTFYSMTEEVTAPSIIPYPGLDLSSLPRLRCLIIDTSIWSSQDFWVNSTSDETFETRTFASPLPWIVDILETASPRSGCLTHVIIQITFKIDRISLAELDWAAFERAVVSPNLTSLKRVQLRVQCYAEKGTAKLGLDIVRMLQEDVHLARLVDAGLLVVQQTDDSRNSKSHL